MQMSKESEKYALTYIMEPRTVSQAMQEYGCRDTMANEFNALINNKTWILVPNDESKNIVGCSELKGNRMAVSRG